MNGEARAYVFAQGEEVMRLACVAIIRAKVNCYWFLDPPKPASKGFPRASAKIDKDEAFFSDHRRWFWYRKCGASFVHGFPVPTGSR